MYAPHTKKMLIMDILDILKKYTDADHRLSQKDICEILKTEYLMKVDRKSVKRNISKLLEEGYDIEYSESLRTIKSKDENGNEIEEESYIMSDFYLNREFSDSELRLLIDGLLFSKHIPSGQCKRLVEKLEGLSNVYFKSRIKHIATFPRDLCDNKQIFYNIEILDEAITKERKVTFKYLEYGTDKKMHRRKRPDGTERAYTVNLYQMAAKEGKYYLICNYDKYDDISNYRLDRICDIEMSDEPVKPFESLPWSRGAALDLHRYMTEHIYMYSSGNTQVKFRITRPMISDVIDLFGKDVRFLDETESYVTVSTNVNELAMEQFARRFAPDVIVLEPKELADKVRTQLEKALKIYDEENVK